MTVEELYVILDELPKEDIGTTDISIEIEDDGVPYTILDVLFTKSLHRQNANDNLVFILQ
jgi:hypothetical protein